MDRRAADRPGQDRRRRLPRHRGDPADVSPLAAAIRRNPGLGGQATEPAGEGERPSQDTAGGGGAGEVDALAAGFCEAVGPCRGNLLSPERRRRAVTILQDRYRASERLVCRVEGQHRNTQRQGGKVIDLEEAKLRNRLREIASEHIRRVRRMSCRFLRREGWAVTHKRVQRLWREEGCNDLLPGRGSGSGPRTARSGATGPSIATRCGPWTSSSTPPPMAADSSS